MVLAGSAAIATGLNKGEAATLVGKRQDGKSDDKDELRFRWERLDNSIGSWWDGDLHRATEEEVLNDPQKTLIFLPFPYSTAGGSEAAFPEMYGWDTQFINLGLLAHDRADIVRNNILDQLSMIDRFGMVLNGNRTFYLTRGQPPLRKRVVLAVVFAAAE